ncbi:alpha/beta fold hydrolase, partial [Streptomyces zhihengii]|uniref:alpha/beta fold hydrolase n=1 Tax=Streptomyces zhihengii TaxID=1818004 RepID=UPI003455DCA7
MRDLASTLDHVRTADGRRLRVECSGDPRGRPVFLLHGMPGSRVGPRPRPMYLYQRGVLLISYDRPGYGGSDRRPGRRVVDVVEDVTAVADALGMDRFAVVGRSGGGPQPESVVCPSYRSGTRTSCPAARKRSAAACTAG